MALLGIFLFARQHIVVHGKITEIVAARFGIYVLKSVYKSTAFEPLHEHLCVAFRGTDSSYVDVRKRISPFMFSTGISFSSVPFLSHSSKK